MQWDLRCERESDEGRDGGHGWRAQPDRAADHRVIVLLVLLFLTRPLGYMPAAVLSSVVFLIGVKLIDIKGMRDLYAKRQDEFRIAVLTALAVAFVGVKQGIQT